MTYEGARDGVILRTKLDERREKGELGVRGHDNAVPSRLTKETSTGHSDKPTGSGPDEAIDRSVGATNGAVLRGDAKDGGPTRHAGTEQGPVQNGNGEIGRAACRERV